MSSHNLDQNKDESFEFILGGNTYNFRYPTTEEIEEFDAMRGKDGELDNKAITDKMYSYITPADEKAPSITEAMKKAKVPVLRAFKNMVESEFGLG